MAINRFDKPAQADFINTYDPIPFQELQQAAQMRQSRHDENLGRLDEAESALSSMPAIAGTQNERDRNIMLEKMGSIRDQYSGEDLSDPEIYSSLRRDIRTNIDRNKVNRITDNAKRYEESQKMKRELTSKGLYNPALDDDPASNPEFGANDEIYDYTPVAYRPKEDTLDKYFDELKMPRNLGINDQGLLEHGRTQQDINNVISNGANDYVNSVSGQQEVKLRRQALQLGEDVSDIDIARDILNEYGQRYKWSEGKALPANYVGGAPKAGFSSPGGTYNVEGATIDRTKARQVERDIKRGAAEVAEMKKLGGDPIVIATKENEITEMSRVNDQIKSDLFDFNSKEILSEVSSLSFLKDNETKSDEVNDIMLEHLDLNKGAKMEWFSFEDPLKALPSLPGVQDLENDLVNKAGLTKSQARRVSREYRKMPTENVPFKGFNKEYRGRAKDAFTKNTSNSYSLTPLYQNSKGQQVYTGVDGNEHIPYMNTIVTDINKGDNFNNYISNNESDVSKRKYKKLVNGIKSNEYKLPSASNMSWALTEGSNISFRSDVLNAKTDKNEGEISFELSQPGQKTQMVQDLIMQGDTEAAYSVSPVSDRVERSIRALPFSTGAVQEFVFENSGISDTKLEIVQSDDGYDVTVLNNGVPEVNTFNNETMNFKLDRITDVIELAHKVQRDLADASHLYSREWPY
jgi:hypothetical protein